MYECGSELVGSKGKSAVIMAYRSESGVPFENINYTTCSVGVIQCYFLNVLFHLFIIHKNSLNTYFVMHYGNCHIFLSQMITSDVPQLSHLLKR